MKTWVTNSTYDGMWQNDQMEGRGTLKRKGQCYVGFFSRGQKHGRGILKLNGGERMGGEQYDGFWCSNEKQGWGRQFFENAAVYEGDWVSGKRHGKGRMVWPRLGLQFQGRWDSDE